MASTKELDEVYMDMAQAMTKLSKARLLKVGCIIVGKDCGVIGEGVNGTPSGLDNECETYRYHDIKEIPAYRIESRNAYFHGTVECKHCLDRTAQRGSFSKGDKRTELEFRNEPCSVTLKTRPEVIHAESNAFAKIMRSTKSSVGATLYCTHAPCFPCSLLIIQGGIARVVFKDSCKNEDGLILLKRARIEVEQYND